MNKKDNALTKYIFIHTSPRVPCFPYTLRLYEVVETQHHIHLVLEHAPSGDLQERVTSQGPLAEATARVLVRQLVSAVQHMVSTAVCRHGDGAGAI